MKNVSSLNVQSFWIFVAGVMVGLLVMLAVYVAQRFAVENSGADLFRYNYSSTVSPSMLVNPTTVDPTSTVSPTMLIDPITRTSTVSPTMLTR